MGLNVTGVPLEFEAVIKTDSLDASVNEINRKIQSTSDTAIQAANKQQVANESLFSTISKGVLAIGATTAAFDFLKDSIHEAMDAEQEAVRFRNILENINKADAFDRLMSAADDLQKKFRYLDNDEIVGVFNKLITYGKLTEQQIMKLTPVIIDFSAKQRISIEQGSSIIIKALEGNTRALKEYGLQIPKAADASERLSIIMSQLKDRVTGAGEAFSETTTGKIATAQQTFRDLKEEIGTGLLPTLNKLLNFVNGALQGLPILAQKIKNTFKDIGTFFTDGLQATKDNIRIRQTVEDYAAADRNVQKQVNEFAEKSSKEIYQKIDELTGVLNAKQKYLDVLRASEMKGEKFTDEDVKNLHNYKLGVYQLSGTIDGLKKLLDKPTGALGLGVDSENKLKETNKDQSELNSLLSERASILKDIKDIQRESAQTGLTDEEKKVDRVAQRYDNLISKIDEYNKKAVKLGRPTLSDSEVQTAKQTAINNTQLRQDAETYKKYLEDQKSIFERYETAKKDIGKKNADELFASQKSGFSSYEEFLKSEVKKNLPQIQLTMLGLGSNLNIGDKLKLKSLFGEMSDFAKQQNQQAAENLKELLLSSQSFSDKRDAIELKYQRLFKTLSDNRAAMGEEEYERRLKALQSAQGDEYNVLKISLARESELYRKLGEDVILFTKKELQQRIKDLKNTLASNTGLTPQMKADIQGTITNLEGLLNSTDETVTHLEKFVTNANNIKGAIDEMATALGGFNDKISGALQLMSGLLQSAINVGSQMKNLQVAKNNGDITGQISAISGVVSALITAAKLIRETFEKVKGKILSAVEDINDFNNKLITGEQEYQALLRERQRQLVLNNKTTLEGIEAQKKLLETQKQENLKAFNDLFAKIQKESFIKGKTLSTNVFDLVFGKDKASKDQLGSLFGKTFDEIEKLFTQGQLTDKAKDLFEQLQKIKQEGVDIDALLEENKKRAQEIFTGTTAESITDTIAEGFKNGLHSASDFAGTFEELMRGAIINSLKFKYLEEPLKKFFEDFAAASESDNQLTQSEIDQLKQAFNNIITNADQQFTQLQQIAGINLGGSSSSGLNSLQGAIKGMTEQTAELLAGQMGGLRLTAIDQLNIAKQALVVQQAIENNTGLTAARIEKMYNLMYDVTTGTKKWTI